ncbi:MAG: low temperature requirement protein A [Nocardioidaceae bacterium]|nr:low temperature requirement protein A [Nocardioidaceae bacterium]NUS53137.1 low temperature requirement protein A [Nocardioidaceae bacterium]
MRAYRRVASPDAHAPVTSLELFFDLVFVLVVTQLTDLVLHSHDAAGYVQAAAVLWVVWWMYDGFAWLANNVGPTTTSTRVPMLAAMAGFLVIAIAVPEAFGEDRWLFATAYLLTGVVHSVSFLRSSLGGSARAILSIAPINLGICAGLFLAAALPERLRWVGWAVAVGLPVLSFVRRVEGGFTIRPAHFAERHRLMLIIALGESVLAIGVSAEGHLEEVGYLVAVLLSVVLISLLWWVHFADDVSLERVEDVVERPEGMTGRTALIAFSLGYLVLVAGLVLVAAGLHDAVHDPAHHLSWRFALTMSVGAATYLLGNVFYLWRLGIGGRRWFVVCALLALLVAPVGHLLGGSWLVAALSMVLVLSLLPVVRDQRTRTAMAEGSATSG